MLILTLGENTRFTLEKEHRTKVTATNGSEPRKLNSLKAWVHTQWQMTVTSLYWTVYSHRWKLSGTKGRHTTHHPNKPFSLWGLGWELGTQQCGIIVQKSISVKVYSEKSDGKETTLPLEALKSSWNSLGYCLLKCNGNDHQGKRCILQVNTGNIFFQIL